MNVLWSFTDYFLDFQKVRNFQELCGLKECDTNTSVKKQLDYSKEIATTEKKLRSHCNNESSKHGEYVEYEPNSKQNSTCYKEMKNGSCSASFDEMPIAKTYQVTNWFLYYLFHFGSALGNEVFYISFIPFVFWNIDPFIARKMVVVWVVTMYIGQALKDIIKWPRPTWPPAFKLETRVEAEYGIPSTHAVAGTALPFSFLMAMCGRYVFPFELGVVLACSWCLLVALSRLYVGMHSILDVMAGITLAAVYLWLGWPFMDMVEEYTMKSTYAPAIIILSHYLLGLFYPTTKHYSTSRGDTVVILGVGAGVHVATWMCYYYSFDYGPVGDPPYLLQFPSAGTIAVGTARTVIGLIVMVTVRGGMKSLSLSLVCWLAGVKRRDPSATRRKDVEVNFKFLTYIAVGFSANIVVPVLLEVLHITF